MTSHHATRTRRTCLALAAACAGAMILSPGAARAQSEGLVDPVQRSALRERAIALLVDAASSNYALERANAIEALQLVPSREPVAQRGIRDENLGVRFAAAMTIGKLRLEKSADLARPLLQDADPVVRAAAVYALRRNGADVDPGILASLLMSDNPHWRNHAAYVLGELGDSSALPMLEEAARDRRMPGRPGEKRITRLHIAEAMVKLGDRAAVDPIRAALYPVNPEEFEAAALAAQMIGEIGEQSAVAELVSRIEERTPDDKAYLQPPELRLAAAASLAKLGHRDGAYVAAAYMRDTNPAIRAQAAFVLGETLPATELARLTPLLEDESPLVRVATAAAVIKIADRVATSGR